MPPPLGRRTGGRGHRGPAFASAPCMGADSPAAERAPGEAGRADGGGDAHQPRGGTAGRCGAGLADPDGGSARDPIPPSPSAAPLPAAFRGHAGLAARGALPSNGTQRADQVGEYAGCLPLCGRPCGAQAPGLADGRHPSCWMWTGSAGDHSVPHGPRSRVVSSPRSVHACLRHLRAA